METLYYVLAVKGTGLFEAGDGEGNAGEMEGMHGAAVDHADILEEGLQADGAVGLGHLLNII